MPEAAAEVAALVGCGEQSVLDLATGSGCGSSVSGRNDLIEPKLVTIDARQTCLAVLWPISL